MAVAVKGVGNGVVGACETELFLKRLVKALDVMDPRRCRATSLEPAPEFPLSEDMMYDGKRIAGKPSSFVSG
jgi:hypothetical protein